MTTPPNLTRPLAHLLHFCGRHFTLTRALSWNALDASDDSQAAMTRIRDAADTVHNLSSLGWNIGEYVEGRASGRALLDSCAHMIRALKAAEAKDASAGPQGLDFEWAVARVAIEEIAAEIEIVEILGEDVPTPAEQMQAAIDNMREKIRKKTSD